MTQATQVHRHVVAVALTLVLIVAIILGTEYKLVAPPSPAAATAPSPLCAPHLVVDPDQRKVLFVQVSSWEGFYNGSIGIHSKRKQNPSSYFNKAIRFRNQYHRGGENYVFASLGWALLQNGFHIDTTNDNIDDFTPQELQKYHRIFKNGMEWPAHLDNHPHILCKIRNLGFWGNWRPDDTLPWDPRQTLAPYPEGYNTFLGFFVHSLVNSKPNHIIDPHRKKQGFLLGKLKELFPNKLHPILQALIDDGFTLHTTCKDPNCDLPKHLQVGEHVCEPNCGLPEGVVFHGPMPPDAYANLMAKMAFIMGIREPAVSPTPLVGLAHGAAWLNPLDTTNPHFQKGGLQELKDYPLHWHHPNHVHAQHQPLSLLGMPYVYNIDLANATNVLQAANWAVQHRFSSYTPPDYMPQAMVARACGIMADDAICQCPNPTFGKHNYHFGAGEKSNVNCHGNSYIQNWQ